MRSVACVAVWLIGVAGAQVATVPAAGETEPVPSAMDAADDPCIWVNPQDPARSTVIGTDKKGGLAVYDLEGRQLQYLPDTQPNNVDIRSGIPSSGEAVDLVVTGDRLDNTLRFYRVLADTRLLEPLGALPLTLKVYGLCLYRSAASGRLYVFINSHMGRVEQWELTLTEKSVRGGKVREFDVGTQTEGCVADDELAHLYIGEENRGVWKYGAEPDWRGERTAVDITGPEGHLRSDVEGLTLYRGERGTGYLIASSQGDDTFAVYRREGANEYLGSFRIGTAGGIDDVTGTDGIDVVASPLGDAFPRGLFVAQDDNNEKQHQNFKLLSWEHVENALQLAAVP